MTMWTRDEAIELCIQIERICPTYGCHVALTGGLLYKEGSRKDLDLVFYRIRNRPEIDVDSLFTALFDIGISLANTWPKEWCVKALYQNKRIDCLFPEAPVGSYPPPQPQLLRDKTYGASVLNESNEL